MIVYMKHRENLTIKVFNMWWWMYVLLTVLVLWAVTFLARDMSEDIRWRIITVLSIVELIILRIYKFSLRNIRSDYNYFNELPCYLCNQSTLLCIIASVLKNSVLASFCASIGTLGAVLAFVMPDRYNRDQSVFSMQAYGFYGYHGLLIITCLLFCTLGLYVPDPKDCIWSAVITFLLACIAHIINTVLRKTGLNPGSNYVFTYAPDNFILRKMYDLFPVKLFYMIPVLPVFSLYTFVFFSVLRVLAQTS